jgi:outer membrane receptor protein involved in Fe transport
MKKKTDTTKLRFALLLSPLLALPLAGQVTPAARGTLSDREDVIVLSPFEVSAEAEVGYAAATTLAGNRLNTELRDIGNAVSVITSQFLKDTGAVNNETLLQYTTGTEVGNIQGNFAGLGDGTTPSETGRFSNPNGNTRVRGLAAADNSRDYFLVSTPWDGYNVDAVDLQRGPNSILFGQGSPAGLINTRTKQAGFRNTGEVDVRFGKYGTTRATLDINRVIIRDELAIRVAALRENEKFQQDPAYELDKRIYAALRYEPAFLKRGSARTIFRATFEDGGVESNRPRSLPPYDFISPYFLSGTYPGGYVYNPTTKQWTSTRTYNHLNRQTFNSSQVQDDNTGRPNHGQQRPSINGGPLAGQANPFFQPWLGNFAQNFNGPLAVFDGASGNVVNYRTPEARTRRGISPTGTIDNGIGGIPYNRQVAVGPYFNWARNSGQPFSQFGLYRNRSLTDPSIFDFYNNLLDGPNKEEWQNFQSFNLNLAQTFMNDKFGFEAAYNTEEYDNGQLSLLSGERYAIFIDPMSVWSNGTPMGAGGEPFQDGTPNPNVGRPFVSDSWQFSNNENFSERESGRLTAFFTHDFSRENRENLLTRILGRHTITGLYAQDSQRNTNRSFQRYAILDQAYYNFLALPANTKFNANELAVNPVVYLGPSLLSRTSLAGANIPRAGATYVASQGTTLAFDSTWIGTNVDPAAPWFNDYFLRDDPRGNSTQSENPANYRGWVQVPFTITDSEAAPGNRRLLTTDARLARTRTASRAVVWQGHLWDRSIVGTYGYREDTAKAWSFARNVTNSPGIGIIDQGPSFKLPTNPSNVLEVTSRSYSIVAHINDLPFLARPMERFPVLLSFFYNRSENFQPAANRVDIYGLPIAAPAGNTIDRGILIETKDNKYSLRINKYVTKVVNASSSAIDGAWFIGASQAWAGNWVNIFEFDIRDGDTIAGRDPNPDPTNTRYNYGTAPGETLEQAQAREKAVIAAWRTWQKSVDPRFYQAWGINLNDTTRAITANGPSGLAVTEDAKSEGYEIEFNASPIRNWRLTFNATRTKASRENIGGASLTEFVTAYQNALRNTPVGDLRIWWGGAGNETALFQWNNNFGSNYTQRKLQEGTNVPELREWRFNAITNYDFVEGRLRGLSVGGGVRWEDEVVIGYRPLMGATAQEVTFDLENPYMGPKETRFDFWVGYGRKLTEKIDWRIQLNLRNAFDGNELIPITTQPDGTPATYRIAPSRLWTVSNTFRF